MNSAVANWDDFFAADCPCEFDGHQLYAITIKPPVIVLLETDDVFSKYGRSRTCIFTM